MTNQANIAIDKELRMEKRQGRNLANAMSKMYKISDNKKIRKPIKN